MAIAWTSSIKQRGQLTVYTGSSLGSGTWAAIFREALREFNSLSRRHGLGVTFAQSSDPPTDSGGADVSVESANGPVSRTYGDVQISDSFEGRRMHGRTLLFSRDGKIEKAFVFLPSQPQVNTPRGMRQVGVNVMKLIAIHELVHACGLTNSEHSSNDLFQGNPQVDPGDTAAGDRVRIEGGGSMNWMPPFVLSGTTVRHIKTSWAS